MRCLDHVMLEKARETLQQCISLDGEPTRIQFEVVPPPMEEGVIAYSSVLKEYLAVMVDGTLRWEFTGRREVCT